MPRGDQTGPMGAGPMTGRARGTCAGYAAPGMAAFGRGRGRGRGFGCGPGGGFGRGFGRDWGWPAVGPVAPTGEQELAVLKQQARQMNTELEVIQGRIQELEAQPSDS